MTKRRVSAGARTAHLGGRWLLSAVLLGSACGSTGPVKQDAKIVAADVPAALPEGQQAFEQALRLIARGPRHYDAATAELERAVRIDGNLFEAWHNLGVLAVRKGRPLDAVRAFEKALEIQPAARVSVIGLAQAHLAAGAPERAHKVYAGWLRADSDDVELRLLYAASLREGGKPRAALEELRALLAADSTNAAVFNALGLVYRKLGKLELAETAFRRALELDSKSAHAWNNLGLIALDRKNDQEAFAHFSRALEVDARYVQALINRAVVYLDCGAYELAESELKRALAVRPEDPALHVALGVSARGRGKPALAVQHYEKALEIQPDYPPALYNLGILFMDHQEDKKRARESFLLFRKVAAADDPRKDDAELRLKMLQ